MPGCGVVKGVGFCRPLSLSLLRGIQRDIRSVSVRDRPATFQAEDRPRFTASETPSFPRKSGEIGLYGRIHEGWNGSDDLICCSYSDSHSLWWRSRYSSIFLVSSSIFNFVPSFSFSLSLSFLNIFLIYSLHLFWDSLRKSRKVNHSVKY